MYCAMAKSLGLLAFLGWPGYLGRVARATGKSGNPGIPRLAEVGLIERSCSDRSIVFTMHQHLVWL